MNILRKMGNVLIALSDLRKPSAWLSNWAGGRQTGSGVQVNPTTALGLSAYYAALRAISEDCGKLPLILYKQEAPRGKTKLIDDPLFYVLRYEPNPEMDAMTFRQTLTAWALGWGNGVAEIVRDGGGRVKQIWPIHPVRVFITRNASKELIYRVKKDYSRNADTGRGEDIDLRQDQVLHIKGPGDGIVGYSTLQIASESLGLGIASQQYGAAFFGNGTTVSGALSHPKTLSEPAQKRLQESWAEAHAGPYNAHKPTILEEGMTWTSTSIPPDEAQFLETRQFQIEEVARWFRIPPHKLQHLLRSTNNNIEQQSIEYVTDTLLSWLIKWEYEIKRKCIPQSQGDVFAEHLINMLLRGDSAARGEFYTKLFNVGALSSNDIREMENLNGIGDQGDKHCVQINMTTLEKVGTEAPTTTTNVKVAA